MEAPVNEVTEMPTTLEAFHSEKMRTMNERLSKKAVLEKEIEKKEAQIETFSGALHSDEYRLLQEELQDLEQQVVHLNKDDERLDYFLQVGDILFNYYDSQEKIASGNHVRSKKVASKLKTPQNSVLNYFSANDGASPEEKIAIAAADKVDQKKVKKARDIEDSNGLQRDKALEKYLNFEKY